MSTYYAGPALDSEIDYRRTTLLQDAATSRLARHARDHRRARRTAARTAAPAGVTGRTRDQVARAA